MLTPPMSGNHFCTDPDSRVVVNPLKGTHYQALSGTIKQRSNKDQREWMATILGRSSISHSCNRYVW